MAKKKTLFVVLQLHHAQLSFNIKQSIIYWKLVVSIAVKFYDILKSC